MNILLLSVGTRNKIVQYFKKDVGKEGKVIATDMQLTAPAIYEADKFYIVPKISDEKYVDTIIDICKKEKINGILSLIDPELNLLAANEKKFRDIGVCVVGSSLTLCDRALNKMKMYKWLLANGYNCARTYDSIESFSVDLNKGVISFPIFVKPICGSASILATKVNDFDTLLFLFKHESGLLIQQFLKGQEIGADVYIDLISHKVISIFTKKKLLMRSGETDKAVSFKDKNLFLLIERFCSQSGWLGQIDIDIFDVNGTYYISEVNPRFGGGYPHAFECGCDHMKMIINNLNGIENVPSIGKYSEDVFMMKYNEIFIKKLETNKSK